MDCEATNTDTERIACYAAHRAAAAERDRKARERAAAWRESASLAEATERAYSLIRGVLSNDWPDLPGHVLHALGEASSALDVARQRAAN